MRRDLALGELAHDLAERLVVLGQLEHRTTSMDHPGPQYLDVNVNVNHDSRMTQQAKGDARTWTVGELADDLGVTTRTLRFYESQGLVTPRRAGGNRVYDPRDRARLRLILRGRRFGMSLEECREIVDMYDGADSSEARQLRTLLGRLDEVAADLVARQDALQRTLTEVTDVADQCRRRLDELGERSS
jgi:DNA-binding transcriptional MerR regulator